MNLNFFNLCKLHPEGTCSHFFSFVLFKKVCKLHVEGKVNTMHTSCESYYCMYNASLGYSFKDHLHVIIS